MKMHGMAPNDTGKLIDVYYKRLQGIVTDLQTKRSAEATATVRFVFLALLNNFAG